MKKLPGFASNISVVWLRQRMVRRRAVVRCVQVTAYALESAQERGQMFVRPGDQVYEGQVSTRTAEGPGVKRGGKGRKQAGAEGLAIPALCCEVWASPPFDPNGTWGVWQCERGGACPALTSYNLGSAAVFV
jgi:hypothetical protein